MVLTIKDDVRGIKKIDLQGRMDVTGTQEIDIQLNAITKSESSDIIFDLSGVDYITSIGIGILVRSANDLKHRKRTVVILKPKPMVFRVLEATKINSIVPIVFDMESAYSCIKQERNINN